MDDDAFSSINVRALVALSLLFAGLLAYSLVDIYFLFLGRNGTGHIEETYYSQESRNGQRMAKMEFTVKESDGFERRCTYSIGANRQLPEVGQDFNVQYLPRWFSTSIDSARPKRPFNLFALGLLLVASIGAGYFAYRCTQVPAENALPRKKRRQGM